MRSPDTRRPGVTDFNSTAGVCQTVRVKFKDEKIHKNINESFTRRINNFLRLLVLIAQKKVQSITLDSAYNEFGYNEHPLSTNRLLHLFTRCKQAQYILGMTVVVCLLRHLSLFDRISELKSTFMVVKNKSLCKLLAKQLILNNFGSYVLNLSGRIFF